MKIKLKKGGISKYIDYCTAIKVSNNMLLLCAKVCELIHCRQVWKLLFSYHEHASNLIYCVKILYDFFNKGKRIGQSLKMCRNKIDEKKNLL